MCSILGTVFLSDHKVTDTDRTKEVLRKLLLESMARGRSSTGLAYVKSHDITVIKKDVSAAKFVALNDYSRVADEFIDMGKTNDRLFSIIGHCRFPTKGSETNNDNNHPIICGDVVGVHNGCIGNDDELFKNFSNVISRKAQVDSEIIFALINNFSNISTPIDKAITRASSYLTGSYACAMVHRKHPHLTWLFRHNNPCEVIYFKESGVLIWASAKHYIRGAIGDNSFIGEGEEIKLDNDTGITIDSHRNRIYRFKLEAKKEFYGHGYY